MNTFGRIFKLSIFGESHGDGVGVTIDGVPSGLVLESKIFDTDLQRRRGGGQFGTTPRKENDIPKVLSGVFNDKTTGAPLTLWFENNNIKSEDYDQVRTIPRPGHADWVAQEKYFGFQDYRGSGHFSARLTTPIVAAGVVAKQILGDATINASVVEIGGNNDLEFAMNLAKERNDSVGALVQCKVENLPIGLGEPFWDSVESLLSHALFSIPAVKGVSFGSGFNAATMYGTEHNDVIINQAGQTKTNHAGGIVGGITNGNDLLISLAFKPASSTPKTQTSWNVSSQSMSTFEIKGRHDLCVALRAPVIVEAMVAIVLADLMLLRQTQKK